MNCRQGKAGAPVHATREQRDSDGSRWAVTLSPSGLFPGEQVFEDYGQPNHIYFMYHGFSLGSGSDSDSDSDSNSEFSGNRHDCARLDVDARLLGPALARPGGVARVQDLVIKAQAKGTGSLEGEEAVLVAGASEIVGRGTTLDLVALLWSDDAIRNRLQRGGFRRFEHPGCVGVSGGRVTQGHDGAEAAERFVATALASALAIGVDSESESISGDGVGVAAPTPQARARARAVVAFVARETLAAMESGEHGATIGEDEAELAGVAAPPIGGREGQSAVRRRLAVEFRLSQKRALRTVAEHWGLGWDLGAVGRQLQAGVFGWGTHMGEGDHA